MPCLTVDDLPTEIISLIASLLAPPYHPPPPPAAPAPIPAPHLVAALDPSPPSDQCPAAAISALCKVDTRCLEGARPWLWENVDVRSGRGWLAVVDALTEEVADSPPAPALSSPTKSVLAPIDLPEPIDRPDAPPLASPIDIPTAVADAHAQPNTVPGGFGHYVSVLPSASYPYPSVPSSAAPLTASALFGTSPPYPTRLAALLTPPASRNVSPASARLRGRSRSPRRVQFERAEAIETVLDRSRSASADGSPGGAPGSATARSASVGHAARIGLHRRTSMSVSRTYTDYYDHEDDEYEHADGYNDDAHRDGYFETRSHDGAERQSPLVQMRTPPRPDAHELAGSPASVAATEPIPNANPELLPTPGPYIRHLSFTNFRTIGSGRTQDEAVRGRYVTAGRLEGVLKNAPNLRTVCLTEYVDSSLSYAVVEELFFRGYHRPRATRNPSSSPAVVIPAATHETVEDQLDPPRPSYAPYEDESEEQMWSRRAVFAPLEALDLTGCVARTFAAAIDEFGAKWLGIASSDDERGRSRRRTGEHDDTETEDDDDGGGGSRPQDRPKRASFAALRRLSLRACTTLAPPLISALVLSMPSLTHLDLSNTRVPPELLAALGRPTCPVRLQSLSLARCPRLDPAAVADFLHSAAASELVELNLFVNPTQGEALALTTLTRALAAPCFRSGRLRYLDLSSAGFTPELLDATPPQPSLLSLGLSHIPQLPLRAVAAFLERAAPNVEVLTLVGTSLDADLRPGMTTLQTMLALHGHLINPATTLPFSLARLDLAGARPARFDLSPGPTRLRVIELNAAVRRAVETSQGGKSEWQVVRSKGGRGWYVDISAGWIAADAVAALGHVEREHAPVERGSAVDDEPDDGHTTREHIFVRHLPPRHPRRTYLAALAEANGRVRSDVGWHSRKMEVVRGEGMIGREGGLGAVGAFAFAE
ncbi:hypothetical protein Q5752_003936 [Cryptotrichosporon argae]